MRRGQILVDGGGSSCSEGPWHQARKKVKIKGLGGSDRTQGGICKKGESERRAKVCFEGWKWLDKREKVGVERGVDQA